MTGRVRSVRHTGGCCRVSEPNSLHLLWAEARRQSESGNYRLAIALYAQLIAEAQASSDISTELQARADTIPSMLNLAEFETAIDAATRLLARARQAENEQFKTYAIFWLCLALAKFDLRFRWPEIKALLLEGLETARAVSDPFLITYHLARLGSYAVRAVELDNGIAWLQEALDTVDDVPDDDVHWFRSDIYNSLAELMIRRRELAEARRYAEISIAERELDDHPADVDGSYGTLAEIHYECGEWVEARHLVGLVLESARDAGDIILEQEAEYLRSKVERELGDLDASISAGNRSLDLAREQCLKPVDLPGRVRA
jgi:tetratricopeptide (TPR) repeat protein